jgi:protein arginine kinase activator
MLCQVCKVNEATVRYTEIVNNGVTEIHLCEKCAQFEDKAIGSEPSFSGMFAAPDQGDEAGVTEAEVAEKCSTCGHSLGDILAEGRVGCAECYTAFAGQLAPLIKKVHGASQHVGKVPSAEGEGLKVRTELLRYRGQLRNAIEVENYEEAARLRDLIRDIEQKMVGG